MPLLIPAGPTAGAWLESGGQVVLEAEKSPQIISGTTQAWTKLTSQSGYSGTGYLQAGPDRDTLYQTGALTGSPTLSYPLDFTAPGTYTVWARGYLRSAAN